MYSAFLMLLFPFRDMCALPRTGVPDVHCDGVTPVNAANAGLQEPTFSIAPRLLTGVVYSLE
jgi:hypothetical protein